MHDIAAISERSGGLLKSRTPMGSLYNFNQAAYGKLETFEAITKAKLTVAPILHVDETGINMGGDKNCLLKDLRASLLI